MAGAHLCLFHDYASGQMFIVIIWTCLEVNIKPEKHVPLLDLLDKNWLFMGYFVSSGISSFQNTYLKETHAVVDHISIVDSSETWFKHGFT